MGARHRSSEHPKTHSVSWHAHTHTPRQHRRTAVRPGQHPTLGSRNPGPAAAATRSHAGAVNFSVGGACHAARGCCPALRNSTSWRSRTPSHRARCGHSRWTGRTGERLRRRCAGGACGGRSRGARSGVLSTAEGSAVAFGQLPAAWSERDAALTSYRQALLRQPAGCGFARAGTLGVRMWARSCRRAPSLSRQSSTTLPAMLDDCAAQVLAVWRGLLFTRAKEHRRGS